VIGVTGGAAIGVASGAVIGVAGGGLWEGVDASGIITSLSKVKLS